jgi:lipid-A-disaccharide synthase
MTQPKKIFVLAGEASGDLLGGPLLEAIKAKAPFPVEFVGIGGETMETQGLKSLFPMNELSIMGLIEVIKHLPHILKRLNAVTNFIKDTTPDAIITIDLPDFSFRIAKRLRGSGIPHIHYVAPTVWAWREGRAKKISKIIDHLLCILPFEPPYFTKHGLPCTFVGHMVTELGIENIPREKFRQEYHIKSNDSLICLLPGSRRSEVERLLPVFKETLIKLSLLHPTLKIAVPVVDGVADLVRQGLQDIGIPVIYVQSHNRYEAMRASDVALAASGTVNLELAIAQVPFVIGYKMNLLTAWLAKFLVKVKYMTMVNILLDRKAIPELFQDQCTPDNLFKAVNTFLSDKNAVAQTLKDAHQATEMLRPIKGSPSHMAADVILKHLA